jgi:hypothetical protein
VTTVTEGEPVRDVERPRRLEHLDRPLHAVGAEAAGLAPVAVVPDEVPRPSTPHHAVGLDGPHAAPTVGRAVREADHAPLDDRRREDVDVGDGQPRARRWGRERCRVRRTGGDLRERQGRLLAAQHVDRERQRRDLVASRSTSRSS